MVRKDLNVNLSGKTAVVTGASRGIGKAISLALARAGANVVVTARTEDDSSSLPGTIYKTTKEIEDFGGRALPVRCDVTVADEVQNMVEKSVSAYGDIDILVNNAGVLYAASFLEADISNFNNVWQVNVLGPFLCTRAVLPLMISRKSGSIINISSGLAESTDSRINVYSASKAALNRMMLKLATEVAEHNIAVNLLYPGVTLSEGLIAVRAARSDTLDDLPPPSVVGPSAVWLAAQDATSYTGKICHVNTFGTDWP
jgi:NAD(P)-dependent dehydrogenase (short-subunit alcohol dehydrogenase family)